MSCRGSGSADIVVNPERYRLQLAAERLTLIAGFDQLVCLDGLPCVAMMVWTPPAYNLVQGGKEDLNASVYAYQGLAARRASAIAPAHQTRLRQPQAIHHGCDIGGHQLVAVRPRVTRAAG